MRSHTGAIITLGNGAIVPNSTKQKINTRRLTGSKMVTADDIISKVLWTECWEITILL